MTATIATLDIKGAFDAVLPGRLIRRLREQGWPANLRNCVSSFVSERKVYIRIDGEIGGSRSINCELPRGSLVLLVLFTLHIAPLFRLEGLKPAFRYADEFAIPIITPNLDENTEKIRDEVN